MVQLPPRLARRAKSSSCSAERQKAGLSRDEESGAAREVRILLTGFAALLQLWVTHKHLCGKEHFEQPPLTDDEATWILQSEKGEQQAQHFESLLTYIPFVVHSVLNIKISASYLSSPIPPVSSAAVRRSLAPTMLHLSSPSARPRTPERQTRSTENHQTSPSRGPLSSCLDLHRPTRLLALRRGCGS